MQLLFDGFTSISSLFAFALRTAIVWLILSGPVYGLAHARLESTATFSNGACIVLLSALQRAKTDSYFRPAFGTVLIYKSA